MKGKENRKMLFVELSSYNHTPQSHQTIIGKLSQPVMINKDSTISLQCLKTGGSMNIFGEDQNIEVVKTYEGITEKSTVRISEHTFKSSQEFLKCLNDNLRTVEYIFHKEKKIFHC